MAKENEVPWMKVFAFDLPPEVEAPTEKKCKCGNVSCKRAKRIRCTCSCQGQHHSEEQRQGMEPLEKALGLDKPEIEFPVEPPTPEELAIW